MGLPVLLTLLSSAWGLGEDYGHTQVYHSSQELFAEWLGGAENLPQLEGVDPSEAFGNLRRSIINNFRKIAKEKVEESGVTATSDDVNKAEFPYFRFIPPYITTLIPDTRPVEWTNKCFKSNKARVYTASNKSLIVEVVVSEPLSIKPCGDFYLFATVKSVAFGDYLLHGNHTFQWSLDNYTTAELFDIKNQGVRVFRFLDNREQTWASVLQTANLFISEATKDVPEEVIKANLDFMAKYRGVTMKPRVIQEVIIDASEIHSGDFLGVIRFDGLDPTLAWAMGSTTGHTTVALWIGGQLYICESTTKDSYWPTNGIQKTPYLVWLQQAKAAGYQVVHSPLKPEFRKLFNETKAIQFFNSVEGVDYGYNNMLWGWVDVVKDNYPCVPPDYDRCLEFEHVPVLFGNLAKVAGPAIGGLLIDQAFNKRVGTTGLNLAEALMEAQKQKIELRTIPVLVEKDEWLYNTTRFGVQTMAPSMVCCVFVCNTWKAAGIFDGIGRDINCAELTNWDDYSLTIFETNHELRPEACKKADPENPTCQLEGKYTLTLNDYHTKDMFPHIAEKCPSLTPKYEKPAKC